MTRMNKLTALAAVVALSVGLAACGGGSSKKAMMDDTDGMEQPDPAATQRSDIKTKITAAQTAVAAVTDEATDAQVMTADRAVTTAATAITNASALDDNEKAAFNTAIGAIRSDLATRKSSRTTAMSMDAEDAAEEAEALFEGLSSGDLEVTISTTAGEGVMDTYGGGDAKITGTTLVNQATDTPTDVEATDTALTKMGKWQGTELMADTDGEMPSSTVVVYTDITAPKAVAFGEVYTLDGNGNLASATVTLAANRSKVKASDFVHTGRKNHDPDPDETNDIARVRGTFNGASGEYRCTASSSTACASHDAGDGVVRLEGTWVFDPDSGAMAMMADPSYAYFGWWLVKSSDGPEVDVFHGVTDLAGDDANLAAPSDISALGGMATYSGLAAGKYAINPGLSPASGGHWTADATLTAKWGSETEAGMISGMVENFMAGGKAMDWSVKLGETALASTGTFNSGAGSETEGDDIVWTVGGVDGAESGAWSGGLRAAGDNGVPMLATGQFNAMHGAVGHILGAFGAHLDE